MSKPLDEMYLEWLYCQVGDPAIKDPTRTYWRMAKTLYTKEFVWLIPNDSNRIEDGKDLRYEFVDQSGLNDVDREWIHLGCSMLELFVGLSRRLAFQADGEPRDWFWQLIVNAGLDEYNDTYRGLEKPVSEILDRIIWRTYNSDGHGGLFPLQSPERDQREVELWYQLNAYILETV